MIVRQQEDAETGEIIIVTVNGTDATCKRLKKYHDGIELISTNPSYETIYKSLFEDFKFQKAFIPLRTRLTFDSNGYTLNENGIPCILLTFQS